MVISQIFSQESILIEALLSLLNKEQKHLISNDIEAIDNILDEKDNLLMRLQSAAVDRFKKLVGLGYSGNESGMQAWLESQTDFQSSNDWIVFQQNLVKVQELNRLNGTLISKHFNRNQQWIGHIQGAFQGNQSSEVLYNNVGQNPFATKKSLF